MLSLHHLEGGTFTLIVISVIKVLSLSPIPQINWFQKNTSHSEIRVKTLISA